MVVGAGAAGLACAKIILEHGVRDLVVCDIGGILHPDRTGPHRRAGGDGGAHEPARAAGHRQRRAGRRRRGRRRLRPGRVLAPTAVRTMATDAIVFAMANPTPEVLPEVVWEHVAIMATGR